MDMRTYGHMDMWTHMDWTCGHMDIILQTYGDIRTLGQKKQLQLANFFPLYVLSVLYLLSLYILSLYTFCCYTFCLFIPFVIIRFVVIRFVFYTFCRTFCPFIPFVFIRYVFRCFVVIRSVVIRFVVIPFVIEPDVLARGGPCRSKYSPILFPFAILVNKLLIILTFPRWHKKI